MTHKFTNRARDVIETANDLAISLGHNYVGTEHLLYGLAKEEGCLASRALEKQGINSKKVLEKIAELIGEGDKNIMSVIGLTPRTKRIIENAFKEAKKQNSEFIGTEHLLIGIIKEADCVAMKIMLDLNVDFEKMYNDIFNVLNKLEVDKNNNAKNKNTKEQTLNQFGFDLTRNCI